MTIMNSITKQLQALTVTSALSMMSVPVMTGCSTSESTDGSAMLTTGTTSSSSISPPAHPVTFGSARSLKADAHDVLASHGVTTTSAPVVVISPATSNSTYLWFNVLSSLLMGGGMLYLTFLHLRQRREQRYAANRALGLTLEEDIERIERRLEKSAGSRDHWHTEFLTDLRKVTANGLLRPAHCRADHIVELMNLRKRKHPVISTIVAPPGAGKSRMAEGLVYSLYHDRNGNHFASRDYDPADRLFPDVDPETLLAFRLNLGQLTHADAEPMFHFLMKKADECVRSGGKCLVLIDEAHLIYEPNGHASAARLLHLISGWTDGQMQHSKGLWAIAGMRDDKYDSLVQRKPKHSKNFSFARRFERWDMPILSGGPLRTLVDEVAGEWENEARITIPSDVRDRAVELMRHDANNMASPYAVLNLLDRVQAAMRPGEAMSRQAIDRSFGRLHRIPDSEITRWSLYEEIRKAVRKELVERFNFDEVLKKTGFVQAIDEEAPLLAKLTNGVVTAWMESDQELQRQDDRLLIPESFIEEAMAGLYGAIANQPTNKPAQDLMRELRRSDQGSRKHRAHRVAQLSSAQGRRSAVNE